MYTTVQKWGNSQGIRIPKSLPEALGIRENDRMELLRAEDMITIKKVAATPVLWKKPRRILWRRLWI